MLRKACAITEISQVMPQVYLLWLEAPELASAAQPGQFFMVSCGSEMLLRRPLSLHRLGRGGRAGQVALLFQVMGKGTRWLAERQVGDRLDVLGPLGRGFELRSVGPILAAAGGLGIAPLLALAESALSQNLRVTLLLGARAANLLYPSSLIPTGVNLVLATDDGSAGEKGRVTDVLPRLLDGHSQVFACGPLEMYRSLQGLMAKHPVMASAQMSTEERMGCGVGLCLGCSLLTRHGLKRVCKEGPVFELGELVL
ncbi:MAG: dihydroorotate dehydrogenase electron transfer subunit [Chloroflexi bacterium]|nr:dihydroorotate dehydrogenase electron transfer subunit [Chloroflexota bacterium]